MSLRRICARNFSSSIQHKTMAYPSTNDWELKLLLNKYVKSEDLDTWTRESVFTEAVRRAVKHEKLWDEYFSALAKKDLMDSVRKEVDAVPKKVKDNVKLQIPEAMKPHLDTFREAIPGHVARSMNDQAAAFFTSHVQTQTLLDRVCATLEQKSNETLDKVVKEEKYHELTNRLEKEIRERAAAIIKQIEGEFKTHLQRQNEKFGVELNAMSQRVNEKTQALDQLKDKLTEDEKEITDLKSSIRNTQIVLGLFAFAGVVGVAFSKM